MCGMYINSIAMAVLLGLLLLVVQTLQLTRADCTEYYVILERKTYFDPDIKINFTDITTYTLTSALLNYPKFNTTEEYSIIQKNKKCMLDLTCVNFKSFTNCIPKVKTKNVPSIEEFESTVSKSIVSTTFTKPTTVTLSTPTKIDNTTPSNTTKSLESSTKETEKPRSDPIIKLTTLTTTVNLTKTTLTLPTATKSPKNTEPPKPDELTPVTILSTESELTTIEVTTLTEPNNSEPTETTTVTILLPASELTTREAITPTESENSEPTETTREEKDKAKAEYLEKERKQKEHVKIGVIVASSLMSGTIVAFAVKKILDARKYGSYRVPESNMDETAV